MKDIQSIILEMTLEEKAALCTGASAWTTTPIERLDVPELICSDGPHGVRRIPDIHAMGSNSLPATCFPTASSLASSWDVGLIRQVGEALGEECIALNVDVLLGPGANMKRSPLGGRNFEYFSEDPYLAGELAANFINGVQSKGVGTSLKHFTANNQEFQRFSISAEIDERTLREIYLPAFEKAVKQAQPWSVMCAYNKVNGTFASEHDKLLNKILKDEWGFKGLVVSDWGAVRDRVIALKGGLDWEMPGPQERRVKQVVAAVKSGELDEAVLDESVRRILRIVMMAAETPKGGEFDIDAHHALAAQIDQALADVKICDPAIGSGAFPVGMMKEIVRAREVLTTYLTTPDDTLNEVEARTPYTFKRHAIQHCLYGVDIDPGAVDIAKLRLWLSLVVDEGDFTQVKPLPNLDYKIVAGNSLLHVQKDLFNYKIFDDIEESKREYFETTSPFGKQNLRNKINSLIVQIIGAEGLFDFGIFFSEVFHNHKGFDIFIGNPPYLEARSPEFSSSLKNRLRNASRSRWQHDSNLIVRGADLLIYFFETGIFNIHDSGQVVFITQNSWLDTEYGKKFQDFLLKHTFVEAIIDSNQKYFDSTDGPNINTVISIFRGKKALPKKMTFLRYMMSFQEISFLSVDDMADVSPQVAEFKQYYYDDEILRNTKWGTLLSSPGEFMKLLDLLKAKGLPLDQIGNARISIGQGLNLTKAYHVDKDDIYRLKISEKALVPFITSADGAPFNVVSTEFFLLDKAKLTNEEIKKIQLEGMELFDRKTTRKIEPIIIMPRGIGRHFCAINSVSGFSASSVEIYDTSPCPSEDIQLNLWLFLNSSIAWLIREIAGRKNLGGGMLKAEAIDLKPIPIYFDFKDSLGIKNILQELEKREALNTLDEIDTEEHQKIDEIVFNFLGIDFETRMILIDLLKTKIRERSMKAKT
jgi:beta-glucosidase-like glycosyl hydrolase